MNKREAADMVREFERAVVRAEAAMDCRPAMERGKLDSIKAERDEERERIVGYLSEGGAS